MARSGEGPISAHRILDDETRRTVGLIRYYKTRLAMETERLQRAAEMASELREEARLLREHNTVLETRCAEAKKYLNFVGAKRRRFREAYYGIVDQEDLEIRDTNRMLRDLIVVNHEITEILKLSHKAERTAIDQVAREEEEFRESISDIVEERKMLRKKIEALHRSVDADDEKRKIIYDNVKFLERKVEAQQAELALLDDRRENAEIQLIVVREEIKRRCPRYVFPSLPSFMESENVLQELDNGVSQGKRRERNAGSEISNSASLEVANKIEGVISQKAKMVAVGAKGTLSAAAGQKSTSPSKDRSSEKLLERKASEVVPTIASKPCKNLWKNSSPRKIQSDESITEKENESESDSFFSTQDCMTSRSSCYQDALDPTQDEGEDAKKGSEGSAHDEQNEEEEELLNIVPYAECVDEPEASRSFLVPMKATLINLNQDLPANVNSERDVEVPLLYSTDSEEHPIQSDGSDTQEDNHQQATLEIGGTLTLLKKATSNEKK